MPAHQNPKKEIEEITPRDFIDKWEVIEEINARNSARTFVFTMFTIVTALTFFLLIGHGLGFLILDTPIMIALIAATIGEIGTLLLLVYKHLFPS